jgi:RNA polymerase sigma factor (sigma-70 family)
VRRRAGRLGNKSKWRNHRIEKHRGMVERIAKQVHGMFPAVPLEDLCGAGYVGLCTAADRLDPQQQHKFERYAWFVIRGAIIDAHKRQAFREEIHESLGQALPTEGMGAYQDFVRDKRPLPDELAAREQMQRTMELLISELPVDVAKLMRAVMAGSSVNEAARQCGKSPAWGRARLAEAKDRIGAGVILR